MFLSRTPTDGHPRQGTYKRLYAKRNLPFSQYVCKACLMKMLMWVFCCTAVNGHVRSSPIDRRSHKKWDMSSLTYLLDASHYLRELSWSAGSLWPMRESYERDERAHNAAECEKQFKQTDQERITITYIMYILGLYIYLCHNYFQSYSWLCLDIQ